MDEKDYVTLKVDDGTEMRAYVARPAGEVNGGVIVFQEAFGVNDYIKRVANKIAEQGYVAVAPELFHRTQPGFAVVEAPFEEIGPHYTEAAKVESVEADARAAHEWLTKEVGDNIGAIGFCMGGRATYIATSILPFKGTISLYGGGITDLLDRVPNLSAPMLFFWGGADARIPRELWSQIPAALDAAGKTHGQIEFSGAPHAYLTDDRGSYHKEASELTWPLILAFFKQKLG